jgi:hypothetical protein
MALTIPQVLRQFKADVGKAIAAETILKICGYVNYEKIKRDSVNCCRRVQRHAAQAFVDQQRKDWLKWLWGPISDTPPMAMNAFWRR